MVPLILPPKIEKKKGGKSERSHTPPRPVLLLRVHPPPLRPVRLVRIRSLGKKSQTMVMVMEE